MAVSFVFTLRRLTFGLRWNLGEAPAAGTAWLGSWRGEPRGECDERHDRSAFAAVMAAVEGDAIAAADGDAVPSTASSGAASGATVVVKLVAMLFVFRRSRASY